MNHLTSAIRQLAKRPGLTAIVVVTLALGIGANAAMFSLFYKLLLRPLPVPEPDRLVTLSAPGPKTGSVSCAGFGYCDQVFSYPMLRDLQREQAVFTGIAAHRGFNASIALEGMQAISAEGVAVNGAYFPVLRLQPALGRLIGPQDEPQPGEGRVVVLSYEYWQNTFGGAPDVLGKLLTINGQRMAVIGVAPEGFAGASIGSRPQVYVPLTMRWLMQPYVEESSEDRQAYWAYLFARLKPGVSAAEAEAALNVPYRAIINEVEAPLVTGLSDRKMAAFRAKSLELLPGARGQSRRPEETRLPLTLLLGVTTLVLAIACVNIANLLLARGAMRAGEMALRSAIGASRGQMIAQLMVEAGLLGLLGCLAGLPFAAATLGLVGYMLPAADSLQVGLSNAAILFAGGVSLATVFCFGLFPALAATRAPAGAVLKEQAGQQSGGRGMARFRRALATAQIAFSLVLLVLAGLFAQSLANLSRVDLGLKAGHVATFSVAPLLNGYSPERSTTLFRRIEEELAALPGATSVASSMVGLLEGDSHGSNVSVQGYEPPPGVDPRFNHPRFNEVSPGFFRTLQIPLLSGRDFSDADIAGRPKVAIVNKAFAEEFGLGTEAVGKRMALGSTRQLDIEIVGVAADAKYSEIKGEMPSQVFLPRYQDEDLGVMHFYVRSELPPETMLASMSRVVSELDPGLPVNGLGTLPAVISDDLFLDRLISVLAGGFALLATLLAATGLYGVLAYSVAQRTRELGLRQALGATPRRLRGMVLGQVGRMALIGGAAGLVLAVLLGRAADAVLFGLSGYEPAVLAAATALLGVVVLIAGYLPARRASSADPMKALRYE
ncbi:MAG TPA: ABC transporter permease [Woeseiaceae bacterium]|nr:ABC transporter permease [Woeseiaceae bacterium]